MTSTPGNIEFLQVRPRTPRGAEERCRCRRPATLRRHPAGADPAAGPFADGVAADPGVPLPCGEYLVLRLTDLDQNLDPSRAETVLVTVTCTETGDRETLVLTETGPNTGVFTGYLPTIASGAAAGDGHLLVTTDCHLTASYTDQDDGSDTVVDAAMVDPYGKVFNSATGDPVDGASVTIIDAATNQPAQVWADDGVSPFPATVTTGDSAYGFPPGGFRFPFVRPGSYRFVVDPPAGYTPPPSGVPFADLQRLPGRPSP